MLLSEILGVDLDTDFGVKGYEPLRFNINTTPKGVDRLYFKDTDGCWIFAKAEMLTDIIYGAPENIIHLPPPLTDEQRVVLMSLYTLGYRWVTRDKYGSVYVHEESQWKKTQNSWLMHLLITKPTKCLESLVTYPDPEPFDIGKALGVGE